MKALKVLLSCLALCLGAPAASLAATATANLNISATVLSVCTISALPVAFGNYAGSVLDATGTVIATCTSGSAYTLSLSAGTTSGATIAARLMANGANTLPYNLYTDVAHSTVWGTGAGATVAGTGTGLPQSVTVYGHIAAGQSSPAGAYTDVVTATITY